MSCISFCFIFVRLMFYSSVAIINIEIIDVVPDKKAVAYLNISQILTIMIQKNIIIIL
jgi:hypothetical protein